MPLKVSIPQIKNLARRLRYGILEEKLFIAGGLFFLTTAVFRSYVKNISPLTIRYADKLSLVLIALGLACFGKLAYQYLCKRVLSKNQFFPVNNAIKGLGQFIDEDGELFSKLGRDQQLHQLRTWVQDTQIPLVVVRGESGVGKSSLLRAGLFHVLKSTQHKHVYCEALNNTTVRDLLKAVNQKFGTQYQELDEVLLMPHQAVIVLDQLEQLNPDNPNDQPVFKTLRQIATELRPPHNITWVIAFRPDYADTWLTQVMTATKIIPEFLSVELFTMPEARNVIGHFSG